MQDNRGRPHKELNDEEDIWLVKFLDMSSDISYANPGRKNHIYIERFDGESKYKLKQYLLWPLRETVSIANGNDEVNESFESKFNKKLTFSQLYSRLRDYEYVYNTDVLHASCLCEICENSSLLVRELKNKKV